MNNRNHRQFLTRAAQRKIQPPTWEFDDGRVFTLRAVADLSLLARILEPWENDPAHSVTENSVAQRDEMFDGIRAFVVDGQQEAFDEMRSELTLPELAELQTAIIEEYGYRNPTQPSSSPDGSPAPMSTTDGASDTTSEIPSTSPQS